MKRLLLVDDDELFRPVLEKGLIDSGFEVNSAANGAAALDFLKKKNFDLVVSDIKMPGMDGVELCRTIKSKYALPVVLMTGFAEILETAEASQLGADGFIPKPFNQDELVEVIKEAWTSAEAKQGNIEENYCRIPIGDFISGKQIQFNIFIKFGEKKIVKIAHKGEDLSLDRIRLYKSKGLHYLYLRKEDFKEYVGFNLKLTQAIRGKTQIDRDKRLSLLRHTGELLLDELRFEEIDNELYNNSATFVQTTLELLTEEQDILNLLDLIYRHSKEVFDHSVAVSLYSVLIARAVNWNLPSNNFKVATGGVLHDIGKKEIDAAILNKPRMEWTVDEVKQYETHPIRGVHLVGNIKSIPEDVIRIIKEHHEDCLSSGFPSRMKRNTIHPMAKLVSVANEFCNWHLKGPNSPGYEPDEAIKKMDEQYGDRLDPEFFRALKQLFYLKAISEGAAL